MNMNAYEEYNTIIMAKFNTATAVRAIQEAVCEDVYGLISMYEYLTPSVSCYLEQDRSGLVGQSALSGVSRISYNYCN